MKNNTKSSVTLPPDELELIESLREELKLKSKVEVVRRGLQLLKEATQREQLRRRYEEASKKLREVTVRELEELDHLTGEGLG